MSNWRNAIHSALGFGQQGFRDVMGGQHDNPAANYKSKGIQGFIPPWLQWYTGQGKDKRLSTFSQGLNAGTNNLADLFTNPGGFAGNISEAIAPRVSMEHEAIGRGTAGGMAEAAGRASRSGMAGTGISQALQAAIQRGGERQKADSTRQAQVDSAQLRRQDLETMLQTYRMLLDWSNAGRDALLDQQKMRLAVQQSGREGVGAATNMIGSIVGAVGGGMGGG